MNHHEIVTKLIGPILPVGETHTDEERYKNLEATIALVDRLLFDISAVSASAKRPEASVSRAGKRASEFLRQVADEIGSGS